MYVCVCVSVGFDNSVFFIAAQEFLIAESSQWASGTLKFVSNFNQFLFFKLKAGLACISIFVAFTIMMDCIDCFSWSGF